MPEPGGPTTQSGIRYQNTVAALYLVQMCGQSSSPEQVEALRAEAPDHVDDLVVTFTSGRRVWVHVKENVRKGDPAWRRLWQDFGRQFGEARFMRRRDGLMLYAGTSNDDLRELREMCERASGHDDAARWLGCLNRRQEALLATIRVALGAECGTAGPDLHALLRHVKVVIVSLEDVELRAESLVPSCGVPPGILVSLLRDWVGRQARYRVPFERDPLVNELSQLVGSLSGPFVPDRNSRPLVADHRAGDSASITGDGARRFLRDVVGWCFVTALLSSAVALVIGHWTQDPLVVLFPELMAVGSLGVLLHVGVSRLDLWARRKLRQKYELKGI